MTTTSLYDNLLAVGYLLLWVITFVWYHRKNRRFDSGSIIIAFYIVYGIVSLLTLNDEVFSMVYLPLRIVPYLYLYGMMMIALTPMISLHNNTAANAIENPHTRTISCIVVMMIVCGLLQVPYMMRHMDTNIFSLFTDVDAGKEFYLQQMGNAEEAGQGVSNIFAIVYNAFYDLSVFLFFYLLTLRNKRRVLLVSFLCILLLGLMLPAMSGQRTAIICGVQSFIVGYLLFKRYMSKKMTRAINIAGISLIIMVMLPVAAITASRFNDRGITRFVNWYVGQGSLYFNNYAFDAGGIRYGDRTLNMLKRVVSSGTPKNYVERREKYQNLEIDDYYFTTFVGDFVIDFGPYIAVVLFLAVYGFILYNIRTRGKTIKLSQVLLVYFAACVSIQGGMYLFAYSDTGNLKMAVIFAFYAYLVYHDKLLEKYPLPATPQERENILI